MIFNFFKKILFPESVKIASIERCEKPEGWLIKLTDGNIYHTQYGYVVRDHKTGHRVGLSFEGWLSDQVDAYKHRMGIED